MKLDWKYYEEIKDVEVFKELEKKYGVVIPDNLKEFINEHNAATPSKSTIKNSNGNERVFGAILSFNESDADNVFVALEVIKDKELIPIGIDPFGNYFCLSLVDESIKFIDHETSEKEDIANNIEEMVSKLY